ncbi:MAG: UDP-N-acetylglucosamine 2-epimerase (non-hydrolyzing) [Deltaproteobacteria bacterium]
MKIVTVVGARPQFVKAAAVRRAIEAYNKHDSLPRRRRSKKAFQEVLVHTGQHYDYVMDGVFFEELQLPKPDHHLGVGSGSHANQTALMLERIETILQKEKPDAVLVYGDTNSTLAGALTAAKLNIPVAHVEAGLRSFNRVMPEETNRLLTDHLSTFLFCPTRQSVQNLSKEGIKNGKGKVVKRVGDVMYDSILHYSTLADKKSTILNELGLALSRRSFTPNAERRTPNYYLATLHRAENTDDSKTLRAILAALDEIGKDVPVILPLHPRTKKMMETYHLRSNQRRVKLIDQVSYLDMITLTKHARIVLTDSGGVQKEAYWLRVPCITLREETEWVETVESGWNVLVGAETKRITDGIRQMEQRRPKKGTGLFGDGKASEKIVRTMVK